MMPKKASIGLIVVFVAFNALVLVRMRNRSSPSDYTDTAEIKSLSSGLRISAKLNKGEYLALIGALTQNSFWTAQLPLAENQAAVIEKLDDLVRDAKVHAILADAAYLDKKPRSHEEYFKLGQKRRSQTVRHAQRLVALGLLTVPQSEFVLQQALLSQQSNAFYDENVQQLFDISESQKEKLAQIVAESQLSQRQMNWMTVNPQEQKENADQLAKIKQTSESATMAVLTQSQMEKWAQLTAERILPAEPPVLPAYPEAGTKLINVESLSPTFRALAESGNSLGLSDEQKRLLQALNEVVRTGLLWINFRNPGGSANTSKAQGSQDYQNRAKFVEHAEQVALLGILTQHQAEQVQEAIKKK